jgi:hypothetical protein
MQLFIFLALPLHVVEEESSFRGEELYRGEKTT